MEFVVPVLMFAFGFGAALAIRRVVQGGRSRGSSRSLPVRKGAIRLDEAGRKRGKKAGR